MPPLAVPSSLVSTMPVTSTTSANTRAWTQAVLPGGGVEHEQDLVDRALLLDDPLDLAQLVHQAGLGVQPAGGVDEHRVDACRSMPRLTASKATEAGSPPSGPRTTSAPTRSPQVSSWSAAAARKVSAAPSTHGAGRRRPAPGRACRQVVVLPVPLTPTTSTTAGRLAVRLGVQRAVHVRVERGDQLVGEQRAQLAGGRGCRAPSGRVAQPLDDLPGGRDADVGGDQGVLDLLPGVLVEAVAGQQGEQALAEGVLRAGQPGAQPDQPARGRRRDLDLRGGDHGLDRPRRGRDGGRRRVVILGDGPGGRLLPGERPHLGGSTGGACPSPRLKSKNTPPTASRATTTMITIMPR